MTGLHILLIQAGVMVAIVLGLLAYKTVSWRKKQPHEWYRGVGIRYMPNAIVSWHGMKDAIDSILEVAENSPELAAIRNRIADIWIEVWPYGEPIITEGHPTGYISPAGFPVRAPRSHVEAAKVRKVTGTRKLVQYLPMMRKRVVICVLQTRKTIDGENHITHRLGTGKGSTRSAGESALFHEIAHHVIPWAARKDWNPWHKDPNAAKWERMLDEEYARRRA